MTFGQCLKKTVAADWRYVLRHAWSVRLLVLAALLSGVEIVLPFWSDYFSRGLFTALSFIATAGALAARLMVQKEFRRDTD